MTNSSSSIEAFNSSDPLQQELLNALAWGETGTSGTNSLYTGTGGSTLSPTSTDAYGFPQWSGTGNSHAAGIFQFQPSTWDAIAAKFGLNFGNASDQEAGAWYNAEQTYSTATGGQSLEAALQAGDFSQIQSALSGQWPSVTGNGANPQGLAAALENPSSIPVNLFNSSTGTSTSGSTPSTSSDSGTSQSNIISYIQRFGLIILGTIIIFIATWKLLGDNNVVPGPGKTFKAGVAAL